VPGAGFVGFAEGARGCSYVHRNISIELSCQLSTQLESPIFVQEKIIVSLRTVRARIVAFLKAPLATSRREGLESFCCQAAVQSDSMLKPGELADRVPRSVASKDRRLFVLGTQTPPGWPTTHRSNRGKFQSAAWRFCHVVLWNKAKMFPGRPKAEKLRLSSRCSKNDRITDFMFLDCAPKQ
jgi:hypothetical protein